MDNIQDNHGIAKNADAYQTFNMMMFPGVENEITRILEYRNSVEPDDLMEAKQILDLSEKIYSAMYKYSKKMTQDEHVLRTDTRDSFAETEKKGETVSFFSTSAGESYYKYIKANTVLIEAVIEQGAVCVDYRKVLPRDIKAYSEQEILVSPFTPVEIETAEMDDNEKALLDDNGKPPERKVKMRIKKQPDAIPLTEEEQKDKDEKLAIYNNKQYIYNAVEFLEYLKKMSKGKTKEQVLENIDVEKMQMYIEWKEAFQTVLKYRTREIALDIDKQIEEAAKQEEQMIQDEELEKLTKTRRTSKINQIVQHFKGLFAEKQPKEQNSQSEER